MRSQTQVVVIGGGVEALDVFRKIAEHRSYVKIKITRNSVKLVI